jgi:hypothetical protein
MRALVALRKDHEEKYARITSLSFDEVCVIFRVGGSLGSFGDDSIEHVYVQQSALCCEVVLAPRDWATMAGDAIGSLVSSRFHEAMVKIRESEYGKELS